MFGVPDSVGLILGVALSAGPIFGTASKAGRALRAACNTAGNTPVMLGSQLRKLWYAVG